MLCLLPKISRLPVSRSKPHRICTDTGSFGSSPVEESAKDAIQAYARPASIGVTGVSGGRHLGPTYDEVVELSRQSRVKPVAQACGPKRVGKVLSASGKFDLIPGGPSREQVHALLNLGVTDMPATKEDAADLIRELRDMQIAQRFGMQELKKEGDNVRNPDGAAKARAGRAADLPITATNSQGPEEHMNMALRGISMITRRT